MGNAPRIENIEARLRPNLFLNGNLDFWLRATSVTQSGSLGSGIYEHRTADRFATTWDTAAGTYTQGQYVLTAAEANLVGTGALYGFRWNQTVGNASNTYRIIASGLENLRQFAGKVLNVSFWAKSQNGAITVSTRAAGRSGAGGSGGWGWSTVGTHSVTTSLQRFQVSMVIPDQSAFTYAGNDYLMLGWWLPGGTATPDFIITAIDVWTTEPTDPTDQGSRMFRRAGETIGGEAAACRRFCRKFTVSNVMPFPSGMSVTTGLVRFTLPLEVPFRAYPVWSASSAITVYRYDGVNSATVSSWSTDTLNDTSIVIEAATATAITSTSTYMAFAGTGVFLIATAELF